MAALGADGTYTLIDSTSPNLLISGALHTWLDSNGGAVTNTGSFVGSNFTVLNDDGVEWILSLADGGQDLELVVSVPKFADQMKFEIIDDTWVNGNVQAANYDDNATMRTESPSCAKKKAWQFMPSNPVATSLNPSFNKGVVF